MDSVRKRHAEFGRVQAQEFSVEDTGWAMQVKFASSKLMRIPMLGDRALGYPSMLQA